MDLEFEDNVREAVKRFYAEFRTYRHDTNNRLSVVAYLEQREKRLTKEVGDLQREVSRIVRDEEVRRQVDAALATHDQKLEELADRRWTPWQRLGAALITVASFGGLIVQIVVAANSGP